ncbi:MAG: hypothetical protein KGS45_13120 [Planctomycetes bacterium]|nr:hypothetical protein [Planctomycetota bacterium]
MGRGHARHQHADKHTEGFSKGQLMEVASISSKTFDIIRKAARVKGPPHGGLSWIFSIEEIHMLIQKARGGNFTERGAPAADAWEYLLKNPESLNVEEENEDNE